METIKSERTRLGLTQQQVSEITGVPCRTIQNWEGGKRKCPAYLEKMILDRLNQAFDHSDYKSILEKVVGNMKRDLEQLKSQEAKQYVESVIKEIESNLKQ